MMSQPRAIDGASVLLFADLSHSAATGATRHVVKGDRPRMFAALVIAQYESDPGFYLFYCDNEWRSVTDTYHDTIDGAIAQAEFEYEGVVFEQRQ